MRGRGLESWAHPKSGDCHQRFLTLSKTHSFFMIPIIHRCTEMSYCTANAAYRNVLPLRCSHHRNCQKVVSEQI